MKTKNWLKIYTKLRIAQERELCKVLKKYGTRNPNGTIEYIFKNANKCRVPLCGRRTQYSVIITRIYLNNNNFAATIFVGKTTEEADEILLMPGEDIRRDMLFNITESILNEIKNGNK